MPTKPRTIRLDLIDGMMEEEFAEFFERWLTKNTDVFEKYAIAREISDEVNKIHYQGIIYIKDGTKTENLMRYFSKWKKHQKSFVPVKNLESYQKYIKKQGDMKFYKGFTDEEIESWGDWEEKTKAEKKVTRRAEQYTRFIKYCKDQKDVGLGLYSLDWIASKLFDFLGKEPLPEQVNWLKGMVFSSQTRLREELRALYPIDEKQEKKSKEYWIFRIMG